MTHVWFSHSLIEGQSSTYIIHGCSDPAKSLILSYVEQSNSTFVRPLSIDTILAEHSLHEWGQAVYAPRNQLITYVRFHFSYNKPCITPGEQENSSISRFTPPQTAEAVERLDSLSRLLHIISEDLTDLQERLHYLAGVHQRLTNLSNDRYDP